MNRSENVIIKGTKHGLTLHLNDQCSFVQLLADLKEKLQTTFNPHHRSEEVFVNIELGNRYLTSAEREQLHVLIEKNESLTVADIYTNVMTKDEVERLIETSTVTPVMRTVRSGQVLQVKGDLLLVGDVNPGGSVIAGGNVYILGALKGSAHAGFPESDHAIIAATVFDPLQIKISHFNFEQLPEVIETKHQLMSCAYVNNNGTISIDKLQVLPQIRPQLTSLKGEL